MNLTIVEFMIRAQDLTQSEWFQIICIPLALAFAGTLAKAVAFAPRIREKRASLIDAAHFGLEFCVLPLGVYWKGVYTVPPFDSHTTAAAAAISLLLLLLCIMVRSYLDRRPWMELVFSNTLGVASLSVCFLVLIIGRSGVK